MTHMLIGCKVMSKKIISTFPWDGGKYQLFGYANDAASGFHATAYQNVATGEVVIAYRGTDPGLFSGETKSERAGHALTTLQDIAVDAKMVRDTLNTQKPAADAFTAEMIAKAAHRVFQRARYSLPATRWAAQSRK
ncbi:TPA: hypothetical protein HH295_12630 [Xanthomonas vasicola pv. zeae]|nr:hypothetical protein [Xanthomonas vasicola]AZR33895.1 hypothetical protein NX08_004750 [Xanthomonas vasicola]MDO6934618.1 hypothetical protein [Xanthomonas vasicola]MDO6938469.1 hypothetical protein [Xanthomonas vasicola]MDO6952551.1 hypothetical protein [Xanthomonas vasicola]MDO6957013.1 hypothetical protein [Xanthomonas vasicola]